jgi:hypothetical protein
VTRCCVRSAGAIAIADPVKASTPEALAGLKAEGLCCINLKKANEPSRMGHSGRKAEELVHKADFACHVTLCQAAILWKPRVGRMTRLSAPWSASMRLFKYFDVRCSTFFDSRPSFCRRWIALGYDASLSVVMDEGGKLLIVLRALRRKR